MSGFLRKATVRNVRRAFREVNAFEWEADPAWSLCLRYAKI